METVPTELPSWLERSTLRTDGVIPAGRWPTGEPSLVAKILRWREAVVIDMSASRQ